MHSIQWLEQLISAVNCGQLQEATKGKSLPTNAQHNRSPPLQGRREAVKIAFTINLFLQAHGNM